jgi:hypothetical protein
MARAMTCVAAKPGLMVSDSRVSGEKTIAVAAKIHRMHGYLVGFAGDMGHWQRLLFCASWPRTPAVKSLVEFCNEYPEITANHVDILVCTKTTVFEIDGGSVSEVAEGAIGTGEAIARGYLAGRPGDVRGAVRAAIAFDPNCGGPLAERKLRKGVRCR